MTACKPVLNSKHALVNEMCLTKHEYSIMTSGGGGGTTINVAYQTSDYSAGPVRNLLPTLLHTVAVGSTPRFTSRLYTYSCN